MWSLKTFNFFSKYCIPVQVHTKIGWNKTYKMLSCFFNGWFKLLNICGAPQTRNRYIYGYFSCLWTDFDQTKMILLFKLYVLPNLTLSFSLSHKKMICVAPSATKINYPFKWSKKFDLWPADSHVYSFLVLVQGYLQTFNLQFSSKLTFSKTRFS